LEQVADVANMLAWKIWQKYPHSWKQKVYVCEYYQERNEASYASRKKMAKAKNIEFLERCHIRLGKNLGNNPARRSGL
jgi:hypothetical protein